MDQRGGNGSEEDKVLKERRSEARQASHVSIISHDSRVKQGLRHIVRARAATLRSRQRMLVQRQNWLKLHMTTHFIGQSTVTLN
jgi:hypothetical protein